MSAPLLVLSYNISHEAMAHQYKNPHFSARALGKKCTFVPGHRTLTKCAVNVAHVIDEIPGLTDQSAGGPAFDTYDFVGLQEATNWWNLVSHAPRTLQQMAAVHSSSGLETMVTFYDGVKYTLDHHVDGAIARGRPFQILVCSETNGTGGVIFINLHNGHRQDVATIAADLSASAKGLPLSSAEQNYRIIVVGDFNEPAFSGGQVTQWKPLDGIGISTEVKIGAKPYTCCRSDGEWAESDGSVGQGHSPGDYIFDSGSDAAVHVPPSYNPRKLCSDHLPVMAVLPAGS